MNQTITNARPPAKPIVRIGAWVFGLFFLAGIATLIFKPSSIGPFQVAQGTVQSTGEVSTGVSATGTRGNAVIALVKLENGSLVQVRVQSGSPIKPGTPVRVRVYRTGAYELVTPL